MLTTIENLNELSFRLSQLKTTNEMRLFFLKEIKKLIPYDFAVFDYIKSSRSEITFQDSILYSSFSKEFEENFIKEYDEYYGSCSYSRWLHREGLSLTIRDSDLLPEEIRKGSIYYNEYISKNGFDHVLNCELAHSGRTFAGFTLYRLLGERDFSDYEVNILNILVPSTVITLLSASDFKNYIQEANVLDNLVFSNKENEVLALVYQGLSNDDIAKELFITVHTVKKHIQNILKKTSLESRNKLINFLHEKDYEVST